MKLFKSLLVAPATLGLLAPMAATANEVTISDFAPAEELAITNSRVDGLEARLNNFEAGSFSETTSASFSADFAIGAVDGTSGAEAVGTAYGFQIDLSTSFTGEDSFDVSIDAGTTDANTTLDQHTDHGTLCSLNFILNNNTAPINFDGTTIHYKNALIDTTKLHGVDNNNCDRLLFKMSIFDETFEQVKNKLIKNPHINEI